MNARTQHQTEHATEFGSNLDFLWATDPRMLGIRMARYKFVAKMLAGANEALEIGAGDGRLAGANEALEIGAGDGRLSAIVRGAVGHLTLCDLDPQGPGVAQADFTRVGLPGRYQAVYALDVLEHVAPEDEDAFMRTLCAALTLRGTCIIGMPSLESQPYASPLSKAGHVNCKTEDGLRELMRRYFHNVYLFGMNDETLHTGYGPMCHYRLALATGKK